MIQSNPNSPTFLYDDLPFHWQMTRCEKFAFASILDAAQPEVAIEVGTYRGGSLQILTKYSKKVYTIEISPAYIEALQGHFQSVDFLIGESKDLLPSLLNKIVQKRERLGFILIDGDHSTSGVRNDINAVLQYKPLRYVYVVFHDSFHPRSRRGLLSVDWESCPFVHYVEIDFIPGVFHYEVHNTAKPRSMYGGLALALLMPEERNHELTVYRSQQALFDTVFKKSRHRREERFKIRSTVKWLRRQIKNL